jgi:hypothetical protein
VIDTGFTAQRVGAGLSYWVCVHADAPLRDYSITCHAVQATLLESWRGDSLTTASCFRATCCVRPVALRALSLAPVRPSGTSRPTVSTAVAGDALDQAVVSSATPRGGATALPRTSSKFDMGGGTGSPLTRTSSKFDMGAPSSLGRAGMLLEALLAMLASAQGTEHTGPQGFSWILDQAHSLPQSAGQWGKGVT